MERGKQSEGDRERDDEQSKGGDLSREETLWDTWQLHASMHTHTQVNTPHTHTHTHMHARQHSTPTQVGT